MHVSDQLLPVRDLAVEASELGADDRGFVPANPACADAFGAELADAGDVGYQRPDLKSGALDINPESQHNAVEQIGVDSERGGLSAVLTNPKRPWPQPGQDA